MKRLIFAALFFIAPAIASAQMTFYINTGSTTGGDGTTNAIEGDNRAFASGADFAANCSTKNVAGAGDFMVVLCSGTAADASFDLYAASGWATSEACYIDIGPNTGQENQGYWSTLRYRIAASSYDRGIDCTVGYVRIHNLQIQANASANQYSCIYINGNISGVLIYGNYFRSNPADKDSRGVIITGGGSARIYNNYFYDYGANQAAVRFYYASGNCYVDNNTFRSCGIGIEMGEGTAGQILRNNILDTCTTAAIGTFGAGTDYNSCTNSTMTYTVTGGGNTHDAWNSTFSFTDASSGNLLVTGANTGIIDTGETIADFSTDFLGTARPQGSAWDRGAQETIASGGGGTPANAYPGILMFD